MRLYVVRHQQSVDNVNNIIQGLGYNSPLTSQGQRDARKLADRIYNELSGKQIYHVVSSPLERATQSAQIIADRLNVPVVYDDSLVEFDPGKLTGSKNNTRELDPQFLEIWNQRGDLDGIPSAERGDNLQARSIYFLERYINSDENLTEVVVSHAGFNRCMVNTARSNPRTQPIEYEYHHIHKVDDPWQTMDVKRLPLAKASQAYRIKTPDQIYVMKQVFGATQREMQFQYEISAHVQSVNILPEVLYWGMKTDHAVQVLKFLEGEHEYGELTVKQKNNLFSATYQLGQRLKAAPNHLKLLYNHTLKEKIEDCVMYLDNSITKSIGLRLLENPRYGYLITEAPQVLVHYDLHRLNILFTPEDEVRILDLGSMVYAPDIFLPASFFMSTFMLQQEDDFSLENLMAMWPERLDKKDIKILMQIRAIIGASFFEQKLSKKNYLKEDHNIYQKYLNALKTIENKLDE